MKEGIDEVIDSYIKRIKDALEEREIVDVTEQGVFISDPVLSMWLRTLLYTL